jgi:hypothetical protein
MNVVTHCKPSGIRELARDIILGGLQKLSIRLDVAYSHCCWPFRSNISPQLHASPISCRSPCAAGGPAPLIAAAGNTLNQRRTYVRFCTQATSTDSWNFSGDAVTFLQGGQRPREARKALSAEFNSEAQRRSYLMVPHSMDGAYSDGGSQLTLRRLFTPSDRT